MSILSVFRTESEFESQSIRWIVLNCFILDGNLSDRTGGDRRDRHHLQTVSYSFIGLHRTS